MTLKEVIIDPNVVYSLSFLTTFKVNSDFFNDNPNEYPPYIGNIEGEVHIYQETVVVIPIEEGVVDTQDQPVKFFIIPSVCVTDVRPVHYRRKVGHTGDA